MADSFDVSRFLISICPSSASAGEGQDSTGWLIVQLFYYAKDGEVLLQPLKWGKCDASCYAITLEASPVTN
jgi:hypothetical protein